MFLRHQKRGGKQYRVRAGRPPEGPSRWRSNRAQSLTDVLALGEGAGWPWERALEQGVGQGAVLSHRAGPQIGFFKMRRPTLSETAGAPPENFSELQIGKIGT